MKKIISIIFGILIFILLTYISTKLIIKENGKLEIEDFITYLIFNLAIVLALSFAFFSIIK